MKVKPRVLRVGLEVACRGLQEWLPELGEKTKVDQVVGMYIVRGMGEIYRAIEVLRDLERIRKESQDACYSGK